MLFTKFDIPGARREVFFDGDTIVSMTNGTIEPLTHRDYAGLRESYNFKVVGFDELDENHQIDYLEYRIENGTATDEEKALYDAL